MKLLATYLSWTLSWSLYIIYGYEEHFLKRRNDPPKLLVHSRFVTSAANRCTKWPLVAASRGKPEVLRYYLVPAVSSVTAKSDVVCHVGTENRFFSRIFPEKSVPPTRNIDVIFPPANIWLGVSLYLAPKLNRLLFEDHLVDWPPKEGWSLCKMWRKTDKHLFFYYFWLLRGTPTLSIMVSLSQRILSYNPFFILHCLASLLLLFFNKQERNFGIVPWSQHWNKTTTIELLWSISLQLCFMSWQHNSNSENKKS